MPHESEAARTARILVEELVASGVAAVCISPGSRSTPLTLAFADHSDIRVFSHIDERAGSFFALGLAKALREPVALVCTSGTAPANYLPAIIEASLSHVPLLVLSADRPPELQDCGANQTIDQEGLFGSYVRFAATVVGVGEDGPGQGALRRLADRAVAETQGVRSGPVHLNCQFREPFSPRAPRRPLAVLPAHRKRSQTLTYVALGAPELPAELVERLRVAQRPLLVVGPRAPDAGEAELQLQLLASRLGAVVFVEPTANMSAVENNVGRVDAYDALLRGGLPAEFPDLILRLGGVPTSKALGRFLTTCAEISQIVLADPGEWPDPFATASSILSGSLAPTLAALAAQLPARSVTSAWRDQWVEAGAEARRRLDRYLEAARTIEGTVLRSTTRVLESGSTLFIGNSLAVRDLDLFCSSTGIAATVHVNRGASGIDGLVSTVFGLAAGHEGPTVGVLGDVSFLHDAGGLLAASRTGACPVLVILDNDGGGIFDHLPLAKEGHAAFEDLFVTSHGRSIAEISRAYGVPSSIVSVEGFPDTLRALVGRRESHVLVVRIDREESQAAHREIETFLQQVPGWN